ncbi:MAG: DUF2155 domain-containing protein [Alphaproteobacteria bacterium]|nr:DUF2155 domain-containing protein [Alphaproteobacteria bacterium]
MAESRPSTHRHAPAAVFALASLLLSSSAWAQSSAPIDEPEWLPRPLAIMQGLDKVTARISRFQVPVGASAEFGTLRVHVATCQQRPPTLPPESAAFVQIDDARPDEPPARVFSGWMFASSPALNALEHPVYDVWVESCSSATTEDQSPAAGSN